MSSFLTFNTIIGRLLLTEEEGFVSSLEFDGPEQLNESPHPVLIEAKDQLNAYFNGSLQEFDIPMNPVGSGFQQQVWKAVFSIPFGETLSYKDVAILINQPLAVRAVARANALNPLPILIPCHRVIGSNGKLTGYSGGLARKEALLSIEGTLIQPSLFPLA